MLRGKLSNRGQVLIIFVFAIIGLVAMTGLAVDGGDVYMDRRGAQNAADAAALAAAVYKNGQQQLGVSGCSDLTSSCGLQVQLTAVQMAGSDFYANDIVNHTVEVHIPPIDGAYSNCGSQAFNCNDYIEVIISTNVNTFFARVLGIGQLHNRVEAVALSKYKPSSTLYGGNSLVELRPHSTSCSGGSGDVYIGGSGTVTLNNGGLFVNSDNSTCALKITQTCPTITLNNAGIQGIGQQFFGCATPVMQHVTQQYQFPPDPLFNTPAECSQVPRASSTDADGYTHLYPGEYASLPPAKNTRLDPGVYCVDSLIKTTNPNSNFVGSGVFIWIKPGGAFDFQGGAVQLSAPTTGQYKGYLLYVDADYTGSATACKITGGSESSYTGVIYAPYCSLTINGSTGTLGFSAQIIAYTIDLEGSANLTFNYDPSNPVKSPEVDWTGLFH